MQCSKCGASELRRLTREGFLEDEVYLRLGYFPWECTGCRSRMMLKHRGERKAVSSGGFHVRSHELPGKPAWDDFGAGAHDTTYPRG